MNQIDRNSRSERSQSEFLGVPIPQELLALEGERMFLSQENLHELMLERPPFYLPRQAMVIGNRHVLASAYISAEKSAGHFPGRPIVPLIRMCECMAQVGLLLASLGGDQTKAPIAVASGESKAHSKKLIEAPAQFLIHVELVKAKMGLYVAKGNTYLGTSLVGSLADIRYVLLAREDILSGKA